MSLITEFTITGDEFANLQKELGDFYKVDIPYFNPFDVQSRLQNLPIDIPRIDVSHGDMTINIIEKYNLSLFKSIILRNVRELTGSDDYEIVDCWGTDMKQGSEGWLHHHLPREIAGVYYHAMDPADTHIEYMIDGELVQYGSELGKMFIWPAGVLHRIPLKTTDTIRRSVSFNLVRKS